MVIKKKRVSVYEDMTKQETKVANFLKYLGIRWNFEQPIYVKDNKSRPRVWTPDFYLPELGMYVEVCGAKRTAYKFRKEIYKDNKIPVIFVQTYKDKKWKAFLTKEIQRIHEQRREKVKELSQVTLEK